MQILSKVQYLNQTTLVQIGENVVPINKQVSVPTQSSQMSELA